MDFLNEKSTVKFLTISIYVLINFLVLIFILNGQETLFTRIVLTIGFVLVGVFLYKKWNKFFWIGAIFYSLVFISLVQFIEFEKSKIELKSFNPDLDEEERVTYC